MEINKKFHNFADVLNSYDAFDFDNFWQNVTINDLKKVIAKERLNPNDLLILLSPIAVQCLEEMAVKAARLKEQYFGKTMQLYTPLYLANYCSNECVYCGFNAKNKIHRKKLSLDEIENEAAAIAKSGIRHLLILTGEAPEKTPLEYLADAVKICRKYFSSVALEIFPMSESDYKELVAAGADSLTVYQEVYDRKLYKELHLAGPKTDYDFRLETPDRGARAGFRSVNIAALLGLGNKRKETFFAALHAQYLEQKFIGTEISLSLPRMRSAEGGFQPLENVSNLDLVQLILAFRLFLPRGGITISTREPADLRDKLLKLGVTRFSAGSKTTVGGYADDSPETGQFDIEDKRTVAELTAMIRNAGLLPVFKDWQ